MTEDMKRLLIMAKKLALEDAERAFKEGNTDRQYYDLPQDIDSVYVDIFYKALQDLNGEAVVW
jgi:hypothetical protein